MPPKTLDAFRGVLDEEEFAVAQRFRAAMAAESTIGGLDAHAAEHARRVVAMRRASRVVWVPRDLLRDLAPDYGRRGE